MAGAQLTPEDYGNYAKQRRNINTTYQLGLSNNQFGRETADNTYASTKRNLAAQYGKMREGLSTGYASGGLLNSGAYQKALTDFGTTRDNAYADASSTYGALLGQLGYSNDQAEQTRTSGLGGVADDSAALTAAQKAALIRAAGGRSY